MAPDIADGIARVATWLQSVVPEEFVVRIDAHHDVYVGHRTHPRFGWVVQCGSLVLAEPRNDLAWIVQNLLSHVQDFVAEMTTDVWPRAPMRERVLPLPDVEIEGSRLRLGYKVGSSWVLVTEVETRETA